MAELTLERQPEASGPRRPRRRVAAAIVAVLAIIFFLLPVGLRAVGVRAHAFENRRLAPAPSLSAGWNFFTDATRFLIDRLPLREQAVHANTWIDRHIFATTPDYGTNGLGGVGSDAGALPFSGSAAQDRATIGPTTPAPKKAGTPPATASGVAFGRDGWLYLQQVLDRDCEPFTPLPKALREWERFLNVIRESGRTVTLLVTPDKSTIYPELLKPTITHYSCGLQGSQILWSMLESPGARRAGIVGLRAPLLAAKAAHPGTRLYFKTDSHWNSVGALTLTEGIVRASSPTVRVLPSEILTQKPFSYSGDLLTLAGENGSEIAPREIIRRAPGAPTIDTPTLVIGDSYTDSVALKVLPALHQYFTHLRYLNWNDATPEQRVRAMRAARNILLETVEREFDFRATVDGFVSSQYVAQVARALGVRMP